MKDKEKERDGLLKHKKFEIILTVLHSSDRVLLKFIQTFTIEYRLEIGTLNEYFKV